MKYILVTGGVISGIGKGVIASSIGVLLKSSGIHITSIKIDPYINIDAGTFSPYEHGIVNFHLILANVGHCVLFQCPLQYSGEVFVLDDGGEVDLDLGNYERFLDVTLHRDNNITTGKIYEHVITKERKGVYLGKTVQGDYDDIATDTLRQSKPNGSCVLFFSCSAHHRCHTGVGCSCCELIC